MIFVKGRSRPDGRRTERRVAGSVVVAVGLAVALGACGGSSGSSDTSSTTSGSGAESLKLLVIADATTDLPGAPVLPYEDAVTAAVKGFESRNKGVKLETTFCDSKNNNNEALECAKKATGGDYDAVIFGNTIEGYLIVKETEAAGIPTIAAVANDETTWNNESVFCLTSTLSGQYAGLGILAKEAGLGKVGSVTLGGIESGEVTVEETEAGLEGQGVTYTGNVSVPVSQTDWSSYIAQALSAGPEGLFLQPPPTPSAIGVYQAALQADPSIKFVQPGYVVGPELAKQPQLQGTAVSAWGVPAQTSGVEGAEMYLSDIEKYAGKNPEASEETYEMTWLGVQIAGQLAEGMEGEISPESFTQALESSKEVDTYGITPPFSGSARGVGGKACVSNGTFVPAEVKGGKVVATNPGQFVDLETGKAVTYK